MMDVLDLVVSVLPLLDKIFDAEMDNVFADPLVMSMLVDLTVVAVHVEHVLEMLLVSMDNVLIRFLDAVETVFVELVKTLAHATLIAVDAVSMESVRKTLVKQNLTVSRIVLPLSSLKSERDRAMPLFKNLVPFQLLDPIITRLT